MKKIITIFIFLLGCSSINNLNLPSTKNNQVIVNEIIKNYENLNNFLNNKKLCDTFLLDDSFELWMVDLKSHIDSNKFYEGFIFEVMDSIGIHRISNHNDDFYINEIKIRSNFNKDIIWFAFKYYNVEKTWKLRFAEYCNNYNQRVWEEDVPCDKK